MEELVFSLPPAPFLILSKHHHLPGLPVIPPFLAFFLHSLTVAPVSHRTNNDVLMTNLFPELRETVSMPLIFSSPICV